MERREIERRRQAFGKTLGEALSVRGVTQRELGEALGLTQSSIAAWKAGNSEPELPDTVYEIERFLELPVGHLARMLGYLPEETNPVAPVSFEEAVLNDPLLDETQKRGLLAMYREWVREQKPRRRR